MYESLGPADIFKCQQCGDCCQGYGGTFVTERDIAAIAAYINTTSDHFKTRYCQMSGSKPLLAQEKNGYCIFWDGLCTIHPVKPRMCRAWPFIEAVIVDSANWEIMAGSCPGIRTDVPDAVIKACVKQVLAELDQKQ